MSYKAVGKNKKIVLCVVCVCKLEFQIQAFFFFWGKDYNNDTTYIYICNNSVCDGLLLLLLFGLKIMLRE